MPLEFIEISSNYKIDKIKCIKTLTQGKSTKTWKIEKKSSLYFEIAFQEGVGKIRL